MRTGLYVLCVFAAAWGVCALWGLGWPAWSWLLPVLISVLVAVYAAPRVFGTGDRPAPQRRRVARLVMTWSGFEAVAIPLACIALANTGHARLSVPVAVGVVGLHFIPLARGLPFPIYYATGAGLLLAAVASLFVPGATGPQVAAGFAAALILWATSLLMPSLIGRTPPPELA